MNDECKCCVCDLVRGLQRIHENPKTQGVWAARTLVQFIQVSVTLDGGLLLVRKLQRLLLEALIPRTGEVKGTELLSKFKRFANHTLLGFVVPHFDVATQREVFSQRVTFKSVIGQDTAKIWVARKENAE